MACEEGYISLPVESAPARFSIETGIICSLFGVQHPLCKWVDEILPSLDQIPPELKKVGKRIARQIRKKLGKASYAHVRAYSRAIKTFNQLIDQVNSTNQLIEDLEQASEGGEVSTLDFCLAGRPPLPESINYGDLFLAYSGLFPDSFLEKLSAIVAYEKFFEYCECCKPEFPTDPAELDPELIPVDFPDIAPVGQCGQYFRDFLESVKNVNQTARDKTLQDLIQETVDFFWSELRYSRQVSDPNFPNTYDSWTLSPASTSMSLELNGQYVLASAERRFPRLNDTGPFITCCEIWTRESGFRSSASGVTIIFNYTHSTEPEDNSHDLFVDIFEVTLDWYQAVWFVDRCNNVPTREPFDPQVIEPIDPERDPCSEENRDSGWEELCPECPECPECPPAAEEQETLVPVYSCETGLRFEVRKLLTNEPPEPPTQPEPDP